MTLCVCAGHRRSYELHAILAKQFGREAIGYREVDTMQVSKPDSQPLPVLL